MTTPPTDVLACIDLSPLSPTVVAEAAAIAAATRSTLHVLHVAAPEPDFVGYDRAGGPHDHDHHALELRDEHTALRELTDAVSGVDVRPVLAMGGTVDEILAEANRLGSALIVVGIHSHGAMHRLLVGSTTDELLRRADRPVVLVPAPKA